MEIARYDMAEKAYQKMVGDFKDSIFIYKAYYGIGMALLKEKKQGEAKKYFIRVIREFPKTDKAVFSRYELARIYMEEKSYKLAERQLMLASKKLEKGIRALEVSYYQAVALEKMEETEKAMDLLDRSIEEYLKVTKEEEEGFNEEEKIEIKSYLYHLFLEKAKIFYENDNFDAALDLYEKTVVDYPEGKENDWIMYRIAMTYEELGKMEKAVKIYQDLQAKYGQTYWAEQAGWRLKNIKWNKDYGEKAKEIGERDDGSEQNTDTVEGS